MKGARKGNRGRDANDDFALALDIEGQDLLRTPVGEPQTVSVPTWQLAECGPVNWVCSSGM
ncbi:MAG TPA: hypothetical protein VF026_24975 [Ktedonobacteraceae bacterium]